MRHQLIVAFSIGLLSANTLPASANSISDNKEYPYLSAQNNRSVLSQWQLAFKEYTWQDGTFSFQMPGKCPVNKPRAQCGYPNAIFNSKKLGPRTNFYNISGGNNEIDFTISVVENNGELSTLPNFHQAALQDQYTYFRQVMEQKRGGKLNPSSTKVKVNGYDGVDLRWDGVDGKLIVMTRIVVAENRIYSLAASTTERQFPALSNDILTFLNSFVIHKSIR